MEQKKDPSPEITKVVITILIAQAIILSALSLVVGGAFFKVNAAKIYREMNRSVAGAVMSAVDEDVMKQLAEETIAVYRSIDDPKKLYETDREAYYALFSGIEREAKYIETEEAINRMRRNTASTCISYVLILPGEDMGIYIFDAGDNDVIPCGEPFVYSTHGLDGQSSPKFRSTVSQSLQHGRVQTDGVLCCSGPEIGGWAYITADIPVEALVEKVKIFTFQSLFVVAAASLLVCAATSLSIRRKVVDPLVEITEISDKFVEHYSTDQAETNVFAAVDGGDILELQQLAASLQRMEQKMNWYLNTVEQLSSEKSRIATELQLAESIQGNMLPNIFPPFPERSEFEIYAKMTPAREVGGDFYDFFLIDDDHMALVIADVSGKGIPAALFMMMSKILMKNCTVEGMMPADVLFKVNNMICQNNSNSMFVTIWIGIFTVSAGKVIAANAGHEYPIICHKGGRYEVIKDPHGFVAGFFPDMKYRNYEFELGEGDTLFVYTDGLPEANNMAGELFGLDRVLAELNRNLERTPSEILTDLEAAVRVFEDGAEPFDDLTMLAVQMKEITGKRDAEGDEQC
ncbi:MAG: PP2C family protein-serine/threonine phosphatase [Solobacterium sp.]|nr:PP2C family protein-serine/threonine phosphatase [Solobacterium sp.]